MAALLTTARDELTRFMRSRWVSGAEGREATRGWLVVEAEEVAGGEWQVAEVVALGPAKQVLVG